MKRTLPFLVLLSSSFALACTSETLDGGTPQAGASGGPSSSASATASLDDVPAGPLAGAIRGSAFALASADLTYSTTNAQWFLTFRNYASDCGRLSGKPPGSDALLVNIGGVEARDGVHTLAFADGHGATFQVGVYDSQSATKPVTETVTGAFSLDAWSAVAGSELSGKAKLKGEDGSVVSGTFTAKVCPSR